MSRQSRVLLSVFVGLVLAGIALAFWRSSYSTSETSHTDNRLRPDDAAVVERGRKLYTTYCAACHGSMLEGQPDWKQRKPDGRLPAPPHDATGHTWHHPDEQLFRITKFGVARTAGLKGYQSDMPAFEKILSDEEIIAALSWIKAQWPDAVRLQHNAINRRSHTGH